MSGQVFSNEEDFKITSDDKVPAFRHLRIRQYGSNLTTPPNSPVPDVYPIVEDSAFSMRVVFGFIMSNIVTFVIGAAIG